MNKRAVLSIAALAVCLALIVIIATRGRTSKTRPVAAAPPPTTGSATPRTPDPKSGPETKSDPIQEPEIPVKEKTPWAKVSYKVKFASGGVFSTKLAKSFGYEYLCLDIGGQSRLLGMSREVTTAMNAQIRGLEKLDKAILSWAGIPVARDRWESFQVDDQVRATLTGKLVEILKTDAGATADQVAAGLELPFEWTDDALKTRALVLLGELDPDVGTQSEIRSLLDSKNPEFAAAAAVALTKAGAVEEMAGRLELSPPEIQAAYLAAFRWGSAGGGEVEFPDGKKFGFMTQDPRLPDPGPLLRLATRLSENSKDPGVRAAALDVMSLHWADEVVMGSLRRALLVEESGEVLTPLLWNRQGYFLARDAGCAARLMALAAKGDDYVAVASMHRLCASSDVAVVQFLVDQVKTSTGARLNAALHAVSVNGHILREQTIRALESRVKEFTDQDMLDTARRTLRELKN